ncbi:hypothetical protein, partial [Yersinia entomophaga]
PAYGWFFAFWHLDSSSNTFDYSSQRLSPLRGRRKRRSKPLKRNVSQTQMSCKTFITSGYRFTAYSLNHFPTA